MSSLPPDNNAPADDASAIVPAKKTVAVPSDAPSDSPSDVPVQKHSYKTASNGNLGSDPRDSVTPEAFFVAPQMLGKPLAKPMARGWAWVVDGAVVAVLSQAGNFFLALALAMLSYQLISKHQPSSLTNVLPERARKLPALMMVVFIGWAGLIGLDWLSSNGDDEPAAPASESATPAAGMIVPIDPSLTPQQRELAELRAENELLKAKEESASSISLIETGRQLLDDIGFGFGWAAVYFSLIGLLWPGQTVGKKLFGLRVLQLNGKPLSVWDNFNRYGGYAAGFATGLLGFAQVFWDANRQAIHDKIAFTVVVDESRR